MTKCRDCAFYDLEAVKDRAGRVRSDRAAKCLWVSTEVVPISCGRHRLPETTWMEPNQGDGCPCFKPREGDTK